MRVFARIFGGLFIISTLLFVLIVPSFAMKANSASDCQTGQSYYPNLSACCYAYDGKNCIDDISTWTTLLSKAELKAGYYDDKGVLQGCPKEATANGKTGTCEVTCASGQYVPQGESACTACPAGSTCPGGTYVVKNYYTAQGVGTRGENCYYSNPRTGYCYETVAEWILALKGKSCNPTAGYINPDSGEITCCTVINAGDVNPNPETGFCECKDKTKEFNEYTGECECPAGMEWHSELATPACCSYVWKGTCCHAYIKDRCFSYAEWMSLVAQTGGAGYIDDHGGLQSCPGGTTPNLISGFCELTCESGRYVPAGQSMCAGCLPGHTCEGGTFVVVNNIDAQGIEPGIYTITLKNYNNTSTHQTIYEKYNTGWYSNSAATASISTATVPSRTGYTFRGFYTSTQTDATSSGNTGTQRITKSGGLPNNTTFTANTTLYAAWAKNCEDSSNCTLTVANNGAVTYTTSCPNGYVSGEGTYNPVCQSSGTANCYRIDLDNTTNGGTGGAPTSIYMYRDTTMYENSSNQSKWCKLYTDSACTTEVANNGNFYTILTTNPTKSHATFDRYVGSNDSSQNFFRPYINYDPSYPQGWYSCIYPNEEYYGINSLGFDASQTPSLTFYAVYSCDEGWRGSCTLDTYYGQTCYSNTACTASPTSTISFNANGGSGGRSGTVTATYGSMVPVITTSNWTTPHRFGYNFGGYTDAQSGGNWYYGSTGSPSKAWDKTTDTTLYAQWNFFDSDKLYFYTFDNGYYSGHGACSRTSCNSLPTYSTAGFTKPTGATWLGWAFLCGDYQYCGAGDATDTGLYAAGTNVTASNVVNNFFGRWNEAKNDSSFNGGLYACWQFNISYELNGGTNPGGVPTTYNNCQNTTLPTPTRDNYVFDGWYENSSFTGNPVTTIPGATTGAKIYYAKWTESPCWHTVLDNTTYGGTGGTTDIYINKSTCNVYANAGCTGSAITALSSTPTKTNAGYTGHYNPAEPGWGALITTSGSDRFTNLKTECNNNRFYSPLVAKYDCSDGYHAASSATNAACVANSYSVHFNSNCPTTASGTMSNQSFTYGTAQNLTNNGFSCTGYTFAGWATSASGAKVYDNQQSVSNLTTTNDGTFELYAKWSAENVTCSAGQYLPANSATCETCPVGFYCPSAGTYTVSGVPQGRTPCPTGYDDGTTTGKTLISQCQISCGKGERVATANAQCSTPSGGWFSTDTTLTNYGEVSPVTYCMKGYTNSGTNPSNHDMVKDCQFSMPAGYKVESNVFAHAAAIRMTSASTPLRIVEIQAINTNNVNKLAGVTGSGSGVSNPARATDNDFTPSSYTTIAAGQTGLWVINGQDNLKSLQIALAPGRYENVTIAIDDGTNTNWVTVFSGDIEHTQQVISANHGESIILTNPATTCPSGQFSTASTVLLGDTPTCTNVNAGYYTSGGGTSATPTAAGNGCLSGNTCGKCPTGWPHSVAGSNEITDCYSDTKSRAWSGTQVACTNPDTTGCSAVTCASCSNPACNYVAYVNASGNADGTIISGCETNNASCQQTVESLTPNIGYHTISGNLEYCPANTYTVTLNKNNGTGGTSSVTVTYDADMPTTNVTMPTRTGYTFAGYYDTSNSTGGKQYYTAKGTSARVWDKTTENPVLYARWAPNMYTVTLSKNTTDTGATDGTSPVVAFYGQAMPTSNPNLLDTAIVTDKGCTASTGAYPYSNGGSGTFYNVFFRVQPNTTYTYTATTAGTRRGIYEFDSIIDPSTYTTSNKITPTRVYKAGGSSGLTTDTFTTSSTTQMVMLYLGNNGVAPTGLSIFPTDMPVRANLTAPTRTNYDLTGYYDATSNGTKYYNYTGGSLTSARTWNKTSDTTLYAQWSQNTVTVNLDTNNNGGSGSCDASVLCDAGASCALPQWNSSTCNITNGSKIFVGWATTNDATSGTFNITAPSSGTATYYAVWVTPTCSVTNGSGAIQNTITNEPKCQATCDTGYHTSGTYYGNAGETTVSYECTPNTYTITVSAGNGVSIVSGTGWTNTGTASMSKTYSYGDTIDLSSVVTPTNKAGYYGTTYTVSGSGSLSNGSFTVGAENATIIVNAEGITAPTAENVTLASNITIGTYRHNSPTLTGTVANASTDYDSGISLYYKLGYVDVSSATATCPSSGYDYTDTPSAGTDNAITLENDAFLAYRCYKVQVYATDGILTSTTTDSSNAVNLSLIQRRLKFNGNEGTVNGSTYKNGYARYGTGLLKAGYVSTTDLNPYTAVREGYAFDGWWTTATGGSQVYDANLNLTSATISGYTSDGNLVLTSNKNLYAHWTLSTCAPGLYMNNGSCVACPENHYCVGGATTAQACPANLYTPNNTIAAYHDEAGDCGRKLHIGTDVLWLRSDKKSMNSANKALNFDFFNNDGVADLFLNLSTNPSPMSSTTNKNFKMNVGGTVYYGCDDGTCQ